MHKRRLWAPGLANLGLGVPAMVPLYLAWWLLTKYLPMDCHSTAEAARSGLTNCDFHTLDHADAVKFLLVVTGLFVVWLIVLVDVLLPRRRGARVRMWAGSAVLVPVPFGVCLGLA
ncbi:hypothetical protein ACFP1Z_09145 [Streptomyces gamaensis]|uniref:DUF2834 domain-containing protein n=1 Tax=Streptomyces gamaensis TaxID=1763542 RepID=A0ABW0YUX2_9ACTN